MSKITEVGRKIELLRAALRETQAQFGRRFAVEQVTVSRWERGAPVARKHQAAIAALAGMSVAEFFHGPQPPRLVPVLAQATSDTFTIEPAHPGSDVAHFKLEIGLDDEVSVRVKGNALLPYHADGDLLIGTRLEGAEIDKALRKECIFQSTNGEAGIRFLHPGSVPGLYTLRSPNPLVSDKENVALDWVAPIKIIVLA